MDISVITNIIGSIGFPIVMCIMLLEWIKKLEEQHKEEMSKVVESVNNNTQALIILTEKINELDKYARKVNGDTDD